MDKHILRVAFDLLDAISTEPSDLEAAFLIHDRIRPLVDCIDTQSALLSEASVKLAEAERLMDEMQAEIDSLTQQRDLYARNPAPGSFATPPLVRWVEADPTLFVDSLGTVRTATEQNRHDYEQSMKRRAVGMD